MPTHLSLQELAYEVPGVGRQVRRQVELPLEDLLDGLLAVLGREGRRAGQHVVHERAQRPPVDGLAVARPQQDLGRHVLDGAAEGEGTVFSLVREELPEICILRK